MSDEAKRRPPAPMPTPARELFWRKVRDVLVAEGDALECVQLALHLVVLVTAGPPGGWPPGADPARDASASLMAEAMMDGAYAEARALEDLAVKP